MAKFSSRHGYDPRDSGPERLEDAPEWMRIQYTNGILSPLTYVDHDSRYQNQEGAPLGIKTLGEKFFVALRQEADTNLYDSFCCWETVKDLVRSVEWYHFYDFVEIVGNELRKVKAEAPHFSFAHYRANVNDVFSENRVAWRLNAAGELQREMPGALQQLNERTEASLKDEFEAARAHYRKAFRYTFERPVDPENGIKEIVSAIESVGRVFYPSASTLGQVIREMRSESKLPSSMIMVLEKFYVMSNAEPGIRHGSHQKSNVGVQDAELALHIGVAFIRYLMAKHGKNA